MLNRLPETSSSENQHQSFQASSSWREWEEEENGLAQTEACCCCKGYLLSAILPLAFVKMHVISAFSIRSTDLAGLSCHAVYFLTDSSSTWLAPGYLSQTSRQIRSLEKLGAKRHLEMSTERYANLPQTLLTPPSSVAKARGRLFYSFLTKLRDLILPGSMP